MNGLAVLLITGIGAVGGFLFTQLRRGGVLDLRQCLTVGHATPGRDGRCTRCTLRMLRVSP